MVSISLGCALVAGRKRVPNPAAGRTALRTLQDAADFVELAEVSFIVKHRGTWSNDLPASRLTVAATPRICQSSEYRTMHAELFLLGRFLFFRFSRFFTRILA